MASAVRKIVYAPSDGDDKPIYVEIAHIIGVKPAAITGNPVLNMPEGLHEQTAKDDLRRTVARLRDFYKPGEILRWLFAPHGQLEGRKAIDLISCGRTAEVLAVIECLEAGAYS